MGNKLYKSSVALDIKSDSLLDGYVVVPNVFTKEECLKIISMKGEKSDSSVYVDGYPYQSDRRFRNSNSTFLTENQDIDWLSNRLKHLVFDINSKYFKFNLSLITNTAIVEYLTGGFFVKHLDIGRGNISLRKLSVVAFLSDPNDYKGGRLCFEPSNDAPYQEQGAVILFPSYLPHKVEEVTEGVRYSLVSWCIGPHFK